MRATSSTPVGPRLVVAVSSGRDDLGIEWETSPDGTNWSAGPNVNRWHEGTLGFLVEQLSGGQRQRVDLILRLADELNTSTLLVTHDLVHLPRMHGVVHVVDGRLVDMAGQHTA